MSVRDSIPKLYQSREVSVTAAIAFTVMAILALVATLFQPSNLTMLGSLIFFVVMGVAFYLFATLTVTVTAQTFECYLGPGLFRRRVPRAEILRAERDRIPWWYGLGLKWQPGMWSYVAKSGPAVLLSLRDGSRLRVSTSNQEGLLHALTFTA